MVSPFVSVLPGVAIIEIIDVLRWTGSFLVLKAEVILTAWFQAVVYLALWKSGDESNHGN